MVNPLRTTFVLLAAASLGHSAEPVKAPPAAGTTPARVAASAATAPAGGNGLIRAALPFRALAPGVMKSIDPARKTEESVDRHDVTELLAVDPNFDFAKDVPFRRDVWMLDFQFKPMRMIWADIPGSNGRMLRKQIWYIVYQVTNPGKVYHHVENEEHLFSVETVDKPIRFSPLFTLEIHNQLRKEVAGSGKAMIEKYIPIVLPAIRVREDAKREFLPSVQMAQKEIRVGESLWGVVTWQDVDPQNVWCSVYVEGLTNAYTWTDDAGKYAKHNGPFREIFNKELKINFWRPGDEYTVKENQMRLGVPSLKDGPPSQPPYEWVWRKTFPVQN